VEPKLDAVVRYVDRLQPRLYLLVVVSLFVAYMLGVVIKPTASYAITIQQEFNETEATAKGLAEANWLAGFSYAWLNTVFPLLPSLVPVYGLLHNAMQWVYLGIATRAVPSQAGVILEDVVMFTPLLSIPETDGLLLALLLMDYARLRNQVLRSIIRRVVVSYITWLLIVIAVLSIIVAMAY